MNEIVINPSWSTSGGRTTLTVEVDGAVVIVQQINVTKSKDREKFVEEIVAKVPTAVRDELEQALLAIAADSARHASEVSAEERASQSTLILGLVKESDVELFHDEDGTAFATFTTNDHRETHRVNSRSIRRWLGFLHFKATDTAANSQAISDAVTTLEGMAVYEGPERVTFIRVAPFGDSIVIDLGDSEWHAVIVDSSGWSVCKSSETPVRFRRASGMRPLPVPEHGGSLEELRALINVGSDAQWALLSAWMVAALRPTGPYPVLAVHGQQGSAKTSLCQFVRQVIDPYTTLLRRPPKEERDLMIAASNSWVVAYDNLSGLSPSLSDSLCVLATGGGFAARELYSDADERLFSAMRPTMINGIDDLATRSDLLDRCVNLKLPVISDDQRRDQAELDAAFASASSRIFGGLLDATSMALRKYRNVRLDRKPRMADFAIWAVAAEPALRIPSGSFLSAYLENRSEASVCAVECAIIGPAIQALMSDRGSWVGTATELLNHVNDDRYSDDITRRRKEWPKSPRGVRSALDRLAPNLRATGIDVGLPKGRTGHANKRLISIEQIPARQVASGTSAAKPPYDPNTDGLPLDPGDPLCPASILAPVAAGPNGSQPKASGTPRTKIAPCASHATHLAGPSSEFDDDYAAAMKALKEEELQ